ncbi:MAG: prephenate dehydratase [Gammaproteobacteria bacterium]|nr:prephenate dehydratase [Gammaproteobacteria bacterium]
MSEEKLGDLRSRIDEIDDQILGLLNERATCATEIASAKLESAEHGPPAFYRPDRESQLLTRLREVNKGPLTNEQIEQLFSEIISCCLSLEQPLTIGYLGPRGTYTESAAVKQFGHFAVTKSYSSIDEIFREVASGNCHYGVVPVENSTEGMVNHTLDCLIENEVKICAEVELPIHHALILRRDAKPKSLKKIFSHEQSLAQCRKWLDGNYRDVERIAVASNAEAARLASGRRDSAAIAGILAAEQYNLKVLHRNIEDESGNTTRFLVLGMQDVGASGNDKTSILVMASDQPGALFKVLGPFQKHEINLSRIETRPSSRSTWSYVFFIDFDGHETLDVIQTVLQEIRDVAIDVRSLGSYPKAMKT